MKKLIKYIPFHFLLFLILGILFQYFFTFWKYDLKFLIGILCFIITLLIILNNKRIKFTITSWFLFFFIGISITFLKNPKNHQQYFENHLNKENLLQVKVYKTLKSNDYYNKYLASILSINNSSSSGNILINIKKDSLSKTLNIDDILSFKSKPQLFTPPKNPHQFNYKKYLNNQYIYHHVHLSKHDFMLSKNTSISLVGYVNRYKKIIKQSLFQLDFNSNELSIINALLLGDKHELSTELKENYTKAGAIHILAISGLHIGIVLLLFSSLLSPLNNIRYGRTIKGILLILILWSFALLTGLSASVTRATTMFTFITIGQYFQKNNHIEFSLISSMLILLLIKPLFIFDIGFQLSYLAVFGIVWIHPKLQKLISFNNYLLRKTWQLITVSLSAQIAILPLSIFYFHQFPGLFIVSNLIIIPFLGILLAFGFLIIFLSLLNITPSFLIYLYGSSIKTMNFIIEWIASKEEFIFNKLHLSFIGMVACYIIIIFSYQVFAYRKTKFVIYFLFSIIFFQGIHLFEKHKKLNKEEFIVFHHNKKTIIGIRNGKHLLTNIKNNTEYFNPLLDYEIEENVEIKHDSLYKNIYNFKNKTILKIDSSSVYKIEELNNPIIILDNNPKINLERLISILKPQQIVVTGDNYKTIVAKWETTCDKEKTPFHQTRQNGAYILK